MKKRIRQFLDKIGQYNRLVSDYKRATEQSPDHAMAYVNWGVEMAQAGKLTEALEKFKQASEIAPGRYEPYLNWGVALAKLGCLEEAIEKFRLATQKDGRAAAPHVLWGAALMALDKPDEARRHYQEAIVLSPHNPEPYVNWAVALARKGAYHEAIKHIKQALNIQGYQPQLYFLWGAVLAELQDYESAIDKFKIALRFMPKHAEAFYFWSVALNRLGRYEEALAKSRRAQALGLEKAEVYLNQGDILANLDRLDVAVGNYQHAVRLEPDLAEGYFSWGLALCRLHRYEEGYEKLAKALALEPDLYGVHQQWGFYLAEQKRYPEAIEHLRLGAIQTPDNLDCLLNLSMSLIKTGQQEEAIALLFEVERKDKWNAQAHYLLGTHFMGAGNLSKARFHLEKALEEKPDLTDASVNLALTLCEQGDTLDAVRTMRPVIRRLPEDARINFFYGVILYRHGEYGDALAKYEKALSLDPGYLEAKIGLAEALLRQSSLIAAENLLRQAAEEDPACVPVLYLLGLCLVRQAEAPGGEASRLYAQALALFEQVIALDGAHVDAGYNRALMLGRLHSPAQMNARFQAMLDLLALQPQAADERAYLLYNWSKALSQLGETTAAEAKMAQARQENPQIEAYMETLAV